MRLRSGIDVIDQLEDELNAPLPEFVTSLAAARRDAAALRVSPTTRNFGDLPEFGMVRRLLCQGAGIAELETIGRLTGVEQVQLTDVKARDLRALSGLSHLKILTVSVSSQLESLAGVETLRDLQLLSVWNVPTLASIDALASLNELRVVMLSGGMYQPMRVPSLAALRSLSKLAKLHLSSVQVTDGRLDPLAGLVGLRRLQLPLHFRRDGFEQLERALPDADGDWRALWRSGAR